MIAYSLCLQPRQCLCTGSTTRPVCIAIAVDASLRPVQLYGGFDEPGEPEHEEYERTEHDDAGEELSLGDEDKDAEEEDEGQDAG